MKLVEVARKMFHIDFTGTASVPASMSQDKIVDELQYGDVFKFGGYFLMTHQVRVNNFKRVGENYVFSVTVQGTVHVPAETHEEALFKMWPTVLNQRVIMDNINVRPSRSSGKEPWEEVKEGFEEPMFTPEEAEALMRAKQTDDPAAWDAVDAMEEKLYRIFLDSGEMPYGVAKARTGDPSNWIADRLFGMSDMEFAGFVRNHTAPARPRLARGKGIGG